MDLDYAENQAARQIPMKMADWVAKLDAFLQFNEYQVLTNPGRISADVAQTPCRAALRRKGRLRRRVKRTEENVSITRDLFTQVGLSFTQLGLSLPNSDCLLLNSGYLLPESDYLLHKSDYLLPSSGYRLPNLGYRLPKLGCSLTQLRTNFLPNSDESLVARRPAAVKWANRGLAGSPARGSAAPEEARGDVRGTRDAV